MRAPYAGSAHASISAARLDPVPLTSTTRRPGSGRADTFCRLFDPMVWDAPPVVATNWPVQQRRAVTTVPLRFAAVAVVVIAIAALHLPFRPRTFCWLRMATGVPCPFCGGTTSVVHLGHGDLRGAVTASPLAMLLAGLVPFLGVVRVPEWWARPVVRRSVVALVLAGAEIWELVRFGLIGA